MRATYQRLKSGAWGIRTADADRAPREGERVTVETRAGEVRSVIVGRVLWTGAGTDGETVSICMDRGRADDAPRFAPPSGELADGEPVRRPRRTARRVRVAAAAEEAMPGGSAVLPDFMREIVEGFNAIATADRARPADPIAYTIPAAEPRVESEAARAVRMADERFECAMRTARTRRDVAPESTPAGRTLTAAAAAAPRTVKVARVESDDDREFREMWGCARAS